MSLRRRDNEAESDVTENGGHSSLRARFHAWWEGYEISGRGGADADGAVSPGGGGAAPAAGAADEAEPAESKAVADDADAPLWTTERISVAEQIWGEGFTQPGGTDYVSELMKPLGLDNSMHVLDLGAGLGGVPRAIAESTGAWVTGYEAEASLVQRANELSVKMGMAKKVPIELYNPDKPNFKRAAYDAVISRESLFTYPDKEKLFGRIVRAVKPFGQILFTDYMLPRPDHTSPALDAWRAIEPKEPHPWSLDEALSALNALHLDVRIHDDISDEMRLRILEGWGNFTKMIASGGMSKAFKRALLKEVELWARRVAMIESGDLKVYRVYARKLANTD